MTRLIDADALYSELAKANSFGELTAKKAIRRLANAPTVDAEPVRHGKWKQTYLDHEAFGERPSIFYCSACCACSNVKTNYCPHCGARMDEE